MRVHAIYHGTNANGPGLRSVVWVRGCSLGCEGCCNRATWDFDGGTEYDSDRLASEMFSKMLPGTKGITVSGGEPMHQAISLLEFFKAVRARRPDFSLGMFTGYTWEELCAGKYDLHEPWPPMTNLAVWNERSLFHAIKPMLDFIKMGRWDRKQAHAPLGESLPPLCSSQNQELILPTTRYQFADFPPNILELNIEADGMVTITGIPLNL